MMNRLAKQLLSLLAALLLTVSPALAQSVQIEGEITLDAAVLAQILPLDASFLDALNGSLTAQQTANGLHAAWEGGFTVTCNQLSDGSVLLSTDAMQSEGRALALPAQTQGNPIERIHAWLDQLDGEQTFANAVYSSLFTRALSVDLTGQMLSPILGEVLAQYPFLPGLLGLDAAAVTRLASSAQTDAVWGNITRYKGDAQQYPDLNLLVLSLHIPSLPHMYLWLRTDEFGSTLKFALEEKDVTDWDETLLVLEEGKSDTGFMISGFTLNFEDEDELNIYLEATLTTPAHALTIECDYYEDYTGDYLWAVELVANEATLGDVMELEIEATQADENADIPDLSGLNIETI